MSAKRRGGRIIVVHGERRYSLCRSRSAPRVHPNVAAVRQRHRDGLLPGATLLLIVLFSVFVLGRPPLAAGDAPMPSFGVAHYTFADFADSYR